MREIAEWFGHLDAFIGGELIAQRVEGELRFEVMHAGLKNRLAVQCDPEPDSARLGRSLGGGPD